MLGAASQDVPVIASSEDLSVTILVWLPLLLGTICCARLCVRGCRRWRRGKIVMDSFDLNEDYTHLDEDSFVPSTQFEEGENVGPLSQFTNMLKDAPRPALGSITNVTYGMTPPPAPAPAHAPTRTLKRRTLCPTPRTITKHTSTTHVCTQSTPVPQEQESQSDDWDSSIDEISGSLPPSKLASSTSTCVERGCNWQDFETSLLLDGKKQLDMEMQEGTLMKSMKSKSQHWEFVSSYLNDMGVCKSPLQCEYRWTRLWKPFKSIFDYERAIPSGQDSYWNLPFSDRIARKLPRSFDRKNCDSIKQKFACDSAVNPGDILVDSSADNLQGSPIQISSGDDQVSGARTMDYLSTDDLLSRPGIEEMSTGKKKNRSMRAGGLRKDFQDCTKQLIHIIDDVEKDRTCTQRDVMEISRSEFETSFKLQQERIVAAQQSSEALMQIASALKSFTSGFGSSE